MKLLVISNVFLCIAALAFPFSVAVTNIALGLVLALGVVSGFWWQGAKIFWNDYRTLTLLFISYFCLLLTALIWSLDVQWGVHILGRHWFWLLAPVVVVCLSEQRWRNYFLIALSAGLFLHLVFCVLQAMDLVHVTTGGSRTDNATGHIGHIGFGVVYGIWAAWLLYLGLQWQGRRRYLLWFLSLWSYVMIFAAQGRSGYLVAIVLAIAVIIKYFTELGEWKKIILVLSGLTVLLGLVLSMGPASERIKGTWTALTGDSQSESDWANSASVAASERFMMWKGSLDIYRAYPFVGVGTGGFPTALSDLMEQGLSNLKIVYAHPHNQYLLALVRWGPAGLLMLLVVLFYWMREGWRLQWQQSLSSPLIFLPALALSVHGMSSSSMEEHFSTILAVLLLAAGMAGSRDQT